MQSRHHTTDELFMQRALHLATLGHGQVSPNPMVGCVIVCDGKIIGEGWHKQYGAAHAEVNAVNLVHDKTLLKYSTVYVSLEPCSHFGKTPPCADLLIREGVKKVVIANRDSNPLVAGNGIKKLQSAGVEVVEGVLKEAGSEVNKRFFTYVEQHRPYIILKWAQTADGFITRENKNSEWISNDLSRQLVHKWRTEEDAILVGTRTAQQDNPQLNVRYWTGRNPVRIVIDRYLKLNPSLHLFNRLQKTICYNVLKQEEYENLLFVKLDVKNFLPQLVSNLYRQKIQSVIVEGGTQTLQAFIDAGLWDEARIFVSTKTFGSGVAVPLLKAAMTGEQKLQTDTLKIYRKHSF